MFHVNKKTLTAIIAAGLACVCLASCKDNTTNTKTPQDNTKPNQTIVIPNARFTFVEHGLDKPTTLESTDKQTLYISATAEKAAFVAENRIHRDIAKNMNEVLSQAYERSKNLYNSMVDQLDASFSDNATDVSPFPWESSSDFACIRNDSKAISVSETTVSKAGGAVVNTSVFTYNFDPTTGNQINQVFYDAADKESFDKADNTMYEKLVEKYGKDVISYENVDSSFVDAAQPCWYFTENGVHIAFNVNTIASEEAGVLELDYSKEELPEFAQKYFN